MEKTRQEKLKISNDLLDAMLVGGKTQEDLWGKDGIITQINKALLERIPNAEMDFHLNNTDEGRAAGNCRNGYGRKTLKSNFGQLELSTPRDRHSTFEPQIIPVSNASKKWTMPISNWSKALSHFYVRYADRFPKVA